LHGRWHGEKFLGPTHVCDDLEIRRKALSAEELGRREGRKRPLAKARSYGFRLPSDPAMALLQVGLQLGLGPAELKLLFPDRESFKNWHSKFSAIPAAENRPDSGATAETPSEGGGRTEAQSGALVRLRPCEARSRSLG